MEIKKTIWWEIKGFVRQKSSVLLLLFYGYFIMVLVLYLSGIKFSDYGYGLLLGGTSVLLLLLGNFIIYHKKIRNMSTQCDAISQGICEMPQADGGMEEMYQSIIRNTRTIYEKQVGKSVAARKDMLEYYTMWMHQVKTPIAAMQLLLQEEEASEKSSVKELKNELFKIEEYVGMVMTYLRTEESCSDYVIMEYPLEELVRQAVRKYAGVFIRKKIKLELAPMPVKILTDEKWTVFVIGQVLSNALKYTTQGAVHIYLEEEKTLVIEDTGIGIAPEDMPRIFEKGYTGYNGRTDKKATGIGLYLCRRILNRLGHTIDAVSKVGNGTIVRIDFSTWKEY